MRIGDRSGAPWASQEPPKHLVKPTENQLLRLWTCPEETFSNATRSPELNQTRTKNQCQTRFRPRGVRTGDRFGAPWPTPELPKPPMNPRKNCNPRLLIRSDERVANLMHLPELTQTLTKTNTKRDSGAAGCASGIVLEHPGRPRNPPGPLWKPTKNHHSRLWTCPEETFPNATRSPELTQTLTKTNAKRDSGPAGCASGIVLEHRGRPRNPSNTW